MTTAVVLGIARAVGETAPLLFTASASTYERQPVRRAAGEPAALRLQEHPQAGRHAIARGFAGALVLMLLVLALFAWSPRSIGRDRSKRRSTPPLSR